MEAWQATTALAACFPVNRLQAATNLPLNIE
jgi:hypothetical protein